MPPAHLTLPPHPPRVVATDLDGTLLRSDGSVSARTRAAMEGAWARGIETVFVTARPPRWLYELSDLVGDHGIAICGNGAFVLDVPTRTVLSAHGFARAEVLALAADLRAAIPGVGFAAERASGPHIEAHFDEPHPADVPLDLRHAPLEDMADEVVGKLLATAPALPHDEFFARTEEVLGDRGVLALSTDIGLAEINAPGVTKAAALAQWCAERGLGADDVWAFGDMLNDIPMLSWAGAGFAVANAHPQVHAAASHGCPSNDDDGVAQVLETLLRSAGPRSVAP